MSWFTQIRYKTQICSIDQGALRKGLKGSSSLHLLVLEILLQYLRHVVGYLPFCE